MRVVLDANVLVSAVISQAGPPREIVMAWVDERFELVASPALLDELSDVLARPRLRRWVSLDVAAEFVNGLAQDAVIVADPPPQPGLTADPDDDYLIVLARAAGADYLVSGDRHLLDLEEPDRRCSRHASSSICSTPDSARTRKPPTSRQSFDIAVLTGPNGILAGSRKDRRRDCPTPDATNPADAAQAARPSAAADSTAAPLKTSSPALTSPSWPARQSATSPACLTARWTISGKGSWSCPASISRCSSRCRS